MIERVSKVYTQQLFLYLIGMKEYELRNKLRKYIFQLHK